MNPLERWLLFAVCAVTAFTAALAINLCKRMDSVEEVVRDLQEDRPLPSRRDRSGSNRSAD